ncbi:MAG: MBL fold metallo-hydrolase [Desulfocapsaceae bacterium]|nr:MBL fold metallo-hydrolase [Desulfocapsaceae bacterium]
MSIIPLRVGAAELFWLSGGDFRLDGGTMFGPVPKSLWQKKIPADADNTIPLCNDPLLIRTSTMNILVDSGLGNKLTPKEQAIFKTSPWRLLTQLASLGLSRQDIDMVILTHGDFDHAGGVVMVGEQGREEVTFPAATHLIQEAEWPDVISPGRRAQESYWPINYNELIKSGKIHFVQGIYQVCPEVRVCLTSGHTLGHQLVEIASQGETAVHLGDLFPTHAHVNPLWVMAYDNFPLEVIACKERYLTEYRKRDAWFTFYHDPLVKACKLGDKGRFIDCWPQCTDLSTDLSAG